VKLNKQFQCGAGGTNNRKFNLYEVMKNRSGAPAQHEAGEGGKKLQKKGQELIRQASFKHKGGGEGWKKSEGDRV